MKTEVKMVLGVSAALLAVIAAAYVVSPCKGSNDTTGGQSSLTGSDAKGGAEGAMSGRTLSSQTLAVDPPATPSPVVTPTPTTGPSIEIGRSAGNPSGMAGATTPGSMTGGGMTPGMTSPATRPSAMSEMPTTMPSGTGTSGTGTSGMGSATPTPAGSGGGLPGTGNSPTDWNALLAGNSVSPSGGSRMAGGTSTPGGSTAGLPASVGPRDGRTPGADLVRPTGGTSPAGTTYTVKQGDTLASISSGLYGSPNYWSKIVQANPKLNPNRLKVGQVLQLPHESEVKPTAAAAPTPKEEKVSGSSTVADPTKQYQVQSGDSLAKIAQRLYGNANRWQEIYDANKATLSSPTKLKIGMILKLPAPPKSTATTSTR